LNSDSISKVLINVQA